MKSTRYKTATAMAAASLALMCLASTATAATAETSQAAARTSAAPKPTPAPPSAQAAVPSKSADVVATPAVAVRSTVAVATNPSDFTEVTADGASLASSKEFVIRPDDKTMKHTFARWAQDSGWQLSWELGADYNVSFNAAFGSDIYKAIDSVCANLNSSGVPAHAIFYKTNHVIRIISRGAAQ